MTCPFCAEEIQVAARVCRFCGASRLDGAWMPPPPPTRPAKGSGTAMLRAGGILLVGSALYELFCLSDPVVLAGALRSGAEATAYHVATALVYAGAGVGLISLRRWGYWAVLAAVAWVTVDHLARLLDPASVQVLIAQQRAGIEGLGDLVEGLGDVMESGELAGYALLSVRLTELLPIAGWWVLGATVFAARRHFRSGEGEGAGG